MSWLPYRSHVFSLQSHVHLHRSKKPKLSFKSVSAHIFIHTHACTVESSVLLPSFLMLPLLVLILSKESAKKYPDISVQACL